MNSVEFFFFVWKSTAGLHAPVKEVHVRSHYRKKLFVWLEGFENRAPRSSLTCRRCRPGNRGADLCGSFRGLGPRFVGNAVPSLKRDVLANGGRIYAELLSVGARSTRQESTEYVPGGSSGPRLRSAAVFWSAPDMNSVGFNRRRVSGLAMVQTRRCFVNPRSRVLMAASGGYGGGAPGVTIRAQLRNAYGRRRTGSVKPAKGRRDARRGQHADGCSQKWWPRPGPGTSREHCNAGEARSQYRVMARARWWRLLTIRGWAGTWGDRRPRRAVRQGLSRISLRVLSDSREESGFPVDPSDYVTPHGLCKPTELVNYTG